MAKKGTKSTKKKAAYSKKKSPSSTKNRSVTGMPKKSVVASSNKSTTIEKKTTNKKKISKVETAKPQLSSIYTKNNSKNDSLEDILLDKLFNYHEKPKTVTNTKKKTSKKVAKATTKSVQKKKNISDILVKAKESKEKIVPFVETKTKKLVTAVKTADDKDDSVHKSSNSVSEENKSNIAVRILFFGFCILVIVLFLLFLNLNHIGDAVSEVVPQSDLTVSYDVSNIDPETSNVTITIHASSDVGLKRILLPNQKVKYLTNETDVSVQYLVNANGTYTFSVSDMSNSVSKVDVVISSYTS